LNLFRFTSFKDLKIRSFEISSKLMVDAPGINSEPFTKQRLILSLLKEVSPNNAIGTRKLLL
jgi:hypothetical protein